MTTSRAESQQSRIGRRRSNTAQSILRPPPPPPVLKFGDTQVLNSWVHDPKDSPAVVFNHSWWPGVLEGDLLRLMSTGSEKTTSSFLFIVPKDEHLQKPQLQVLHRNCIYTLLWLTRVVSRYPFLNPSRTSSLSGITLKLYLRRLIKHHALLIMWSSSFKINT